MTLHLKATSVTANSPSMLIENELHFSSGAKIVDTIPEGILLDPDMPWTDYYSELLKKNKTDPGTINITVGVGGSFITGKLTLGSTVANELSTGRDNFNLGLRDLSADDVRGGYYKSASWTHTTDDTGNANNAWAQVSILGNTTAEVPSQYQTPTSGQPYNSFDAFCDDISNITAVDTLAELPSSPTKANCLKPSGAVGYDERYSDFYKKYTVYNCKNVGGTYEASNPLNWDKCYVNSPLFDLRKPIMVLQGKNSYSVINATDGFNALPSDPAILGIQYEYGVTKIGNGTNSEGAPVAKLTVGKPINSTNTNFVGIYEEDPDSALHISNTNLTFNELYGQLGLSASLVQIGGSRVQTITSDYADTQFTNNTSILVTSHPKPGGGEKDQAASYNTEDANITIEQSNLNGTMLFFAMSTVTYKHDQGANMPLAIQTRICQGSTCSSPSAFTYVKQTGYDEYQHTNVLVFKANQLNLSHKRKLIDPSPSTSTGSSGGIGVIMDRVRNHLFSIDDQKRRELLRTNFDSFSGKYIPDPTGLSEGYYNDPFTSITTKDDKIDSIDDIYTKVTDTDEESPLYSENCPKVADDDNGITKCFPREPNAFETTNIDSAWSQKKNAKRLYDYYGDPWSTFHNNNENHPNNYLGFGVTKAECLYHRLFGDSDLWIRHHANANLDDHKGDIQWNKYGSEIGEYAIQRSDGSFIPYGGGSVQPSKGGYDHNFYEKDLKYYFLKSLEDAILYINEERLYSPISPVADSLPITQTAFNMVVYGFPTK
ncbi:MAG: hypothetical protein CL521_04440 [Actinobacteria bacterium]|nr:hypothetical protein [Actinomycetota bacterium]